MDVDVFLFACAYPFRFIELKVRSFEQAFEPGTTPYEVAKIKGHHDVAYVLEKTQNKSLRLVRDRVRRDLEIEGEHGCLSLSLSFHNHLFSTETLLERELQTKLSFCCFALPRTFQSVKDITVLSLADSLLKELPAIGLLILSLFSFFLLSLLSFFV